MASLHSVVLASFVAQVKSVMFYDLSVSAVGWGDCVPVPRAVQSVRLQLPRRQVCAWPTLHVGSLEALVAALLSLLMRDVSVAVFQGYVRKVEGGRST